MWEGKTNGGILHCHYHPRERKATKVSALSPEILTFQIFAPRRTVPESRPLPDPYPLSPATPSRARLAPPTEASRADVVDAATLAEAKPNETAHVVRNWMSYAEE